MRSETIRDRMPYECTPDTWEAFWLKEIAYQLAVMNEREKATASDAAVAKGWNES